MNNKGHKKYLNVEFDEAIADYTEALRLCPTLAVALYNRGTVHYRLGHLQQAQSDLTEAVQLEPTNSDYLEGLQECIRLSQKLSHQKTP